MSDTPKPAPFSPDELDAVKINLATENAPEVFTVTREEVRRFVATIAERDRRIEELENKVDSLLIHLDENFDR